MRRMTQITGPVIALLLLLSVGALSRQVSSIACCRKYSTGQPSLKFIRGFSIQTMTKYCNINAIIFHTNGGRHVCADPSQPSVMDYIRKLRERAQALEKNKKSRSQ